MDNEPTQGTGLETLECDTCQGMGEQAIDAYRSAKCADCDGSGQVQCSACDDGTAADLVFDGCPPLCVTCATNDPVLIRGHVIGSTDAGAAWQAASESVFDKSRGHDIDFCDCESCSQVRANEALPGIDSTQEVPAVEWDDKTEPGPVFEVLYPTYKGHYQAPSECITVVELQAIGGE